MDSLLLSEDQLAQKARALLRALRVGSPCIKSCALVSYDGLMVASVLAQGVDADRFAAMCASLLGLSSRAAKEVDCGALRQIIVDGEQGPMLLTRAGSVGVLAVAATPINTLGKLILDTRATANALAMLQSVAVTA
jgi:predicted regulator of Ras-like GTPase activity (Roadblock/LC7/MglB family)